MEHQIANIAKHLHLRIERNALTKLTTFMLSFLNQLLRNISPQRKKNLLTNDVLYSLPHSHQVEILNKLNKL
jgi:hypothetical protein